MTDNPNNEIEITSLNEYLKEIKDIRDANKENEGGDTDPQSYFFRGQADISWKIEPGIFRNNMLALEGQFIPEGILLNSICFIAILNAWRKCSITVYQLGCWM